MNIGQLKNRITIERRHVTRDAGIGSEVVTWQEIAQVMSRAEPMSGREYFTAKQLHAEDTVVFTIRYRAGIEAEMRIVWNGLYYDIQSVIDVLGLRKKMEIITKQGLTNG